MKVETTTSSVKVGCCGFGMAQAKYAQIFSTVEVQQTFYQPPQISTLEKWRAQAPSDFEFAIKAWQLITHEATSPTYRRLKRELSDDERKSAGSFRLTGIVKEAWQVTVDCAAALKTQRILFQCPASFTPTKEHLQNMRKFFNWIERPKNTTLYWEPRGADWTSDVVLALCNNLDLFHVVDPFVSETVTPQKFYYRLHGRTGWRHQFNDDELKILTNLVPPKAGGCVYFNNVRMVEDAIRFKMLSQSL